MFGQQWFEKLPKKHQMQIYTYSIHKKFLTSSRTAMLNALMSSASTQLQHFHTVLITYSVILGPAIYNILYLTGTQIFCLTGNCKVLQKCSPLDVVKVKDGSTGSLYTLRMQRFEIPFYYKMPNALTGWAWKTFDILTISSYSADNNTYRVHSSKYIKWFENWRYSTFKAWS